jgi:hypothetical protein
MKEIIGAHEAAARSLSVMQKVASKILNHDHSNKLEHCQKMESFCRKLKVHNTIDCVVQSGLYCIHSCLP